MEGVGAQSKERIQFCHLAPLYFKAHKDGLPDPDAGIGCHALLLKLFSNDIWRRLWKLLDQDGDGKITSEELKVSVTSKSLSADIFCRISNRIYSAKTE